MTQNDDNKPEITKPTDQQDLERRQADDYQPDAELASRRTFVNPNPFGEEGYVGTDPVYQNYASETEKPLASEEGAEKKAEDEVKEAYAFPDDVDESRIVSDPGTGGQALVADVSVPVPPSVEVKGQVVDRNEETKTESSSAPEDLKPENTQGGDAGPGDQDRQQPTPASPAPSPTSPTPPTGG